MMEDDEIERRLTRDLLDQPMMPLGDCTAGRMRFDADRLPTGLLEGAEDIASAAADVEGAAWPARFQDRRQHTGRKARLLLFLLCRVGLIVPGGPAIAVLVYIVASDGVRSRTR